MKNDLLIVKADVDPKMLKEIRKQTETHSSDVLAMVVETPGGSPMHAYRAMIFLRSIYNKIYFIVFDEAMSAGTLMALGSDAIYLEDGACLGPLDLQIPHPTDDSVISTLDVRDTALSTVSEASVVMLKICNKNLEAGLPKTIAIDAAIKMATNLYKPIMDKIDPFHLHESYRNAELSTNYGANLLLKGMINDQHEATKISAHLANNYSYHGYAIIKQEAKNLGLKIVENPELSDVVDLDKVKGIYDAIPSGNTVFISANDRKNEELYLENKKGK